jgi:adenylate cyclase
VAQGTEGSSPGRTRAERQAGRERMLLLGIWAVAVALASGAWALDLWERLELDTVDARFAVRGTEEPPPEVAVVEIDDVTFGDLEERWPIRRSWHGKMIDRLSEIGVRAIGYDVQFTEPSGTDPASVREDNALIRSTKDAPGEVVFVTTEVDTKGETSIFGGDAYLESKGGRPSNSTIKADPGGVFRRVEDEISGLETFAVVTADEAGEEVETEDFPEDGAWIDFPGPPRSIDTYEFSEVLGKGSRTIPDSELRDRIVVVGTSAPTVQDVHPSSTSGDRLMSGPEIQAAAISTILDELPLRSAGWPLGFAAIALLGLVAPAAGMRFSPVLSAILAVAAVALYLLIVQLAFDAGTILPVVYPLLAAGLAVLGTLAVQYLRAAFERRRVHDTFARFVPEEVVGEVLECTDDDLRLGGVRREGTVLFSDLRGFTSAAESLEPDEVIELLNRYLGEMSDAIMDAGGTLVSFMGDGIMAVFGAPLEQPDHADRALAAAREMLGPRLERFNDHVRERGIGDGFKMGVGLNSGYVMSGQVGSERRVEYTAVGDTTNTAARLEGMTKGKPYSLLLASSTRDLLTDDSGLERVGEVEVRGREAKLEVWTLSSPGT